MPATATRPTVLVVDDEPDMRELARLFLETGGFDVVGEAADGAQAVDQYLGMEAAAVPSVVLLDNRMPVMTGLEAAGRILARRPTQLVVLYSAFLDDEARHRARGLGVAACVDKTDIGELPQILRTLLDAC
jgi:two-component system, chemotaxis family, chemotaxis protein CheY